MFIVFSIQQLLQPLNDRHLNGIVGPAIQSFLCRHLNSRLGCIENCYITKSKEKNYQTPFLCSETDYIALFKNAVVP
jgi:hypothetical protein